MDNDYTQITWPEVRKGDVLLHENGDRLTVERSATRFGPETCIKAVGLWCAVPSLKNTGFTPYRRKPEMPTEPGAFHDKDGDVVVLTGRNGLYPWLDLTGPRKASEMEPRAPFTRLVPMPTEEQVLEAVTGPEDWVNVVATSATERVMALLNGEGDDD